VTAVIDRGYQERWNEPLGHLVLFEALPDRNDEAVALLGAAVAPYRGCTTKTRRHEDTKKIWKA